MTHRQAQQEVKVEVGDFWDKLPRPIQRWMVNEYRERHIAEEAMRWREYPKEKPVENGTYLVNGEWLADWLDGSWWLPYPLKIEVECWLPIPDWRKQ